MISSISNNSVEHKHSLIIKNISTLSYSVWSNSSNSTNSVQYKYSFYLQSVKCQNSFISNNKNSIRIVFIYTELNVKTVLFDP